MNTDFEIRQLPLSLPMVRQRVKAFLAANSLRLDEVDYMAGITRIDDDTLLACGGLKENIIKCVAVDPAMREENLSLTLISHLISTAATHGHTAVRVYTKPTNRLIFQSMGFNLIAEAPCAIIMENATQTLNDYKQYLAKHVADGKEDTKRGFIVMNANPFTRGHQYLIETAAQQVAQLFVIAVREDRSAFAYSERLDMIKAGCQHLDNVVVLEGSDYQISSTTFPSYFLKEVTDATDTHIELDLDISCRHIAPSLGATLRFVGSEPVDALTQRYNQLMHKRLPDRGIAVVEVPRMTANDTTPVSASTVRKMLGKGAFNAAAALVPDTTKPYLLAHLATNILQQELDLTPKPGLIDRHDNGAHHDMDYRLMEKSIRSLHPYFVQTACNAWQDNIDIAMLQDIGRRGEAAMLKATQGVNTHKGALFALGLAVAASAHLLCSRQTVDADSLRQVIRQVAQGIQPATDTHGQRAMKAFGVRGALAEAQEGYEQLFTTWLPFAMHDTDDAHLHRLLLLIMSTLDDTNILHRCGKQTAQRVKQEAQQLFNHFDTILLPAMNDHFVAENISPGGAADMLSLTLFIKTLLT